MSNFKQMKVVKKNRKKHKRCRAKRRKSVIEKRRLKMSTLNQDTSLNEEFHRNNLFGHNDITIIE